MARKKQLIIPLFIPFSGCTHRCVFCNQTKITGESRLPTPREITEKIEAYLATWEPGDSKDRKGKRRPREAAFYGGSFTALATVLQVELLGPAHAFVKAGRLDSLRVSTRPDAITPSIIETLERFRVTTIELGVQSMDAHVLRLSGRGHTKEQTRDAAALLKESGIKLGLQIMPGLPGETFSSIIATATEVAALAPDFVRVYPTLVLKSTPLETLYLKGEYSAWPLADMVRAVAEVAEIFERAGIPIVRMGLAPGKELEAALVAGPYHPAFKDLVDSERRKNRQACRQA